MTNSRFRRRAGLERNFADKNARTRLRSAVNLAEAGRGFLSRRTTQAQNVVTDHDRSALIGEAAERQRSLGRALMPRGRTIADSSSVRRGTRRRCARPRSLRAKGECPVTHIRCRRDRLLPPVKSDFSAQCVPARCVLEPVLCSLPAQCARSWRLRRRRGRVATVFNVVCGTGDHLRRK